MKKVKYRQENKNSCGSAALANIFDDDRFLAVLPQRYESMAELGRKMAAFRPEFLLNTVFQTNERFQHNNRFIAHQIPLVFPAQPDHVCIPFLITYVSGKDRAHCVAIFQNGDKFYYVDSARENVICTTISELVQNLHILSVHFFSYADHEKDSILAFYKSELDYII